MSMMMAKLKVESESRQTEEKKISDRKRNIIVLIARHLINIGQFEISSKLQQDTNISLDKWDVADNIDLYMILVEFEQFYEMKFMKPPKLIKQIDKQEDKKLPKLQNNQVSTPQNRTQQSDQNNLQNLQKNSRKQTHSSNHKVQLEEQQQKNKTDQNSIEIQGSAMSNKQQKEKEDKERDHFIDARVLKGLPDYSDIPEFHQLAQYLQRDICVENPNVKFTDIAGLDVAKRLIKEAVLVPLKYPHFFQGILEPWRGVLLFGPPGTGKTMLAKAVATECKTTFFNVQVSSIISKWRGESEKLIRVLFDLARHYEPSTIFIDELDSIMGSRSQGNNEHEGSRRMKTELLIQLDGLMKTRQRVFLLAASNIPWDLDMAMLRRLEKRVQLNIKQFLTKIFIPLPDLESRKLMLQNYLPEELSHQLQYDQFAKELENYSGSDIKMVCKEAAMKPLRRLITQIDDLQIDVTQFKGNLKKKHNTIQNNYDDVKPGPVTNEDFMQAMIQVKPSPSQYENQYIKWEKDSGST